MKLVNGYKRILLLISLLILVPNLVKAQINGVRELNSNTIVQYISAMVTSLFNAYIIAAQQFTSNPSSALLLAIILFILFSALFMAIYNLLFEIFMQKLQGTQVTDQMQKAKTLMVFSLGTISAFSIGYAVPFLVSFLGFALFLIMLLAIIVVSYYGGRSVFSAAKVGYSDIERIRNESEKKLLGSRKSLSETEWKIVSAGVNMVDREASGILDKLHNVKRNYSDIMNKLEELYKNFLSALISEYTTYSNELKDENKKNDINTLINEIKKLERSVVKKFRKDPKSIPKLKSIAKSIIGTINGLGNLDGNEKKELITRLNHTYNNIITSDKYKELQKDIDNIRELYNNVVVKEISKFLVLEKTLKNNLGNLELSLRKTLGVPSSKKVEMAILNALKNYGDIVKKEAEDAKNKIEALDNLINLDK